MYDYDDDAYDADDYDDDARLFIAQLAIDGQWDEAHVAVEAYKQAQRARSLAVAHHRFLVRAFPHHISVPGFTRRPLCGQGEEPMAILSLEAALSERGLRALCPPCEHLIPAAIKARAARNRGVAT